MKFYLKTIENFKNIIVFDDLGNYFEEDEHLELYTTSYEDYEWWQTLANAIDFLETKGISTLKIDVNELGDYITVAKENGFIA